MAADHDQAGLVTHFVIPSRPCTGPSDSSTKLAQNATPSGRAPYS